MKASLSSIGEFGLIRRFQKHLPALPNQRWISGIGDDASVLRLGEKHFQLLTHDLLLEKVHFRTGAASHFFDIGWKALAVNLSDIAAMGGVPQEAVVGLGIPSRARLKQLDELYRGLGKCSKKFHCPIVGGDTNRSPGGWVISVAVSGFSARLPLMRSGASPGDTLWVTGTLGGAAVGLKAQQKKGSSRKFLPFLRKLMRPEPRLLWGQRLQETRKVTAMIDISDGLAGDLQRLSEASKVGFEVDCDRLPTSKGLSRACKELGLEEIPTVLAGGEDYELLFTQKAGEEHPFFRWAKKARVAATLIGKAVPGREITFLKMGKPLRKRFSGFKHF